MGRCAIHLVALLVLPAWSAAAQQVRELRVPPGFEVTEFADDQLAHNIYSVTIDHQGHVVVSGPGYVKRLHDDDQDGRADRAAVVSTVPVSGAQGMLFDGPDLVCTGDNALMKLCDVDKDGTADSREVWTNLRNPEHGAHGLVWGPDGWIYLIAGNDAGVAPEHAGPGSCVTHPESGALMRFSRDGKQHQVIAHGFRNPYDLDFHPEGHVFTVDSDGERDQYLPWYVPTRLFDIAEGEHHGWVHQGWTLSWSRPAELFDSADRVAELGRGSPTGLVVYHHRQFPARYRDGIFSCCWTLGRVYFLPLTPHGSTYRAQAEPFLETVGDIGFAPVDLAVAADGSLFVALGGRGTRGGVFRVRYAESDSTGSSSWSAEERLPAGEPIDQVLRADMPLAAWSQARWIPLAVQLGSAPFRSAALDPSRSTAERIRAVEILVQLFGGVGREVADPIAACGPPELRGRLAWALGRQDSSDHDARLLARLALDTNPRVARAAWEALAMRQVPWKGPVGIVPPAARSDRRVRSALVRYVAITHSDSLLPVQTDDLHGRLIQLRVHQRRGNMDSVRMQAAAELFLTATDHAVRLEALRLIQLGLGDVQTVASESALPGFSAAGDLADTFLDPLITAALIGAFPTGHAQVDRELVRVLAMIRVRDDELPDRIVRLCDIATTVEHDLHYLMALARIAGRRTDQGTKRTAAALLALHGKMKSAHQIPSRNWPEHVGRMVEQLCAQDAALPEAIVQNPDFGEPEHALFALHVPRAWQQPAARKLLARVDIPDEPGTLPPELIEAAALLPDDECFAYLRQLWWDPSLRGPILAVLARNPCPEDEPRFLDSLDALSPDIVDLAAGALAQRKATADAEQIGRCVAALRRVCSSPQHVGTRKKLATLLVQWAGQPFAIDESGRDRETLLADYQPWFDWYRRTYPEQAARYAPATAGSAGELLARMSQADWSAGSAERGRDVFQRLQCAACHTGQSRLGPDLKGITRRLARDDLFHAIVDPNRDVSPTYQTTVFVTRSGQTYEGTLVYESPGGTLVQTGPLTTVRVAGDEIILSQPSSRSLMPEGLLQTASNQDVSDLYAYLKTIE